jgi:peptidoglycan/xylan/chitin deacetylase (PgdA/CDA1 family)
MMYSFLQKKIRPALQKFGLYDRVYVWLFSVLSAWYVLGNRFNRFFFKTAVILVYHRIAELHHDPHLLCVTPDCFDSHLQFLKDSYEVIALPELVSRITNKQLTGHEAVITFDDGYVDNLTAALPLLEKYNLPATIFITTGLLGQTANFSWDTEYRKEERATFLSEPEISLLSKHPLITLGAHTETHPRLTRLTYSDQLAEIQLSQQRLQQVTGQTITYFAYPFGGILDFSPETQRALAQCHFTAACTTLPKFVTYKTNLHELPRINVRNYTVPTLREKLSFK